MINREGLENFLRETKQLSPEHIQELVQKIQQFTPNQYPKMISEYLEWKTKVFMAQQRELQLVSFGWIFDRIKEGMNITVSSQQNFAQDFVFQSIDNIEIQS
ncbi:MAG: hypothetical protein LBG59_06355 [Candidatus Peribacteria bacterium]|jgi:hypothetical protein|nr:hypothetical protein [Candidatus Peribacteria bacterium]